MELTLQRRYFKPTYTIGRLYVDGCYFCDTLEPPSARLSRNAMREKILAAKARRTIAVPTGTYAVRLSPSQRFHRKMPFLDKVPCFTGVMIHPGNYPRDTRGCILPGWNRRRGMVCASRSAMAMLMERVRKAADEKEKVTVRIVEKPTSFDL